MDCKNCKDRRDAMREAYLSRKLKESLIETAKAGAEVLGLKQKTGTADKEAKAKTQTQKGVAKNVKQD